MPIAATSAVALRAPKPGMVARRRAAWSSRARATNSAVSAAMQWSSSPHSRHMSSVRRRVRELRVGSLGSVGAHRHEKRLELPTALANHDATLQENGAELVDQGCPLADRAAPGTCRIWGRSPAAPHGPRARSRKWSASFLWNSCRILMGSFICPRRSAAD